MTQTGCGDRDGHKEQPAGRGFNETPTRAGERDGQPHGHLVIPLIPAIPSRPGAQTAPPTENSSSEAPAGSISRGTAWLLITALLLLLLRFNALHSAVLQSTVYTDYMCLYTQSIYKAGSLLMKFR